MKRLMDYIATAGLIVSVVGLLVGSKGTSIVALSLVISAVYIKHRLILKERSMYGS